MPLGKLEKCALPWGKSLRMNSPMTWGLKKVGLWMSTLSSLVWWFWTPPSCREGKKKEREWENGIENWLRDLISSTNFSLLKWWFHKRNLLVNRGLEHLRSIKIHKIAADWTCPFVSVACHKTFLTALGFNWETQSHFSCCRICLLKLHTCLLCEYCPPHRPRPAMVFLGYPDSLYDVCWVLLVLKIIQYFYIKVSTLMFNTESWAFFT